jgi:hypothetical protein
MACGRVSRISCVGLGLRFVATTGQAGPGRCCGGAAGANLRATRWRKLALWHRSRWRRRVNNWPTRFSPGLGAIADSALVPSSTACSQSQKPTPPPSVKRSSVTASCLRRSSCGDGSQASSTMSARGSAPGRSRGGRRCHHHSRQRWGVCGLGSVQGCDACSVRRINLMALNFRETFHDTIGLLIYRSAAIC